jgi:predicted nucleic acid-binding protein
VTAFYVDTSAAVKLVVAERGSRALTRWATERQDSLVSSDLLRTELLRAVRRGAPRRMERARAVLDTITIITMPTSTFERAADIQPDMLRSLDALHLAAALEFGDELEAIVAYDDRLTEAARRYGIPVVAPT